MLVTLSPKSSISSSKVNFTFKSTIYNQYVQTHMSWHEEKFLIKQQKSQIPIRILPAVLKQNKHDKSMKASKNSKLIKMPIPKFEMDKQIDSQFEDNQQFKASLGLQRENSFLISSQQTTLPFHISNKISAETQTDDFTFVDNLFSQPKIYEIPVEMQLQKLDNFQQEGVQVSEILLKEFLQKLQLNNPAVLRQHHLQMNSGVMSLSISNYSFSKSQQFHQKKGSVLSNSQNQNDSEGFQQQEELLLQNSPQNENKQNLFKTANFQHPFPSNDFYSTSTPHKSRISGSQSSPDTNGPMRISQREINMMQTKQIPTARIDEQEYEDLQSRFYALQQQNADKLDQIQVLNKRVQQLLNELQKLQIIKELKNKYQQRCKQLQKQVENKCLQIEQVQYNLVSMQKEYTRLQQMNVNKQQQMEDILLIKQKQMLQLQRQINEYRQQIGLGEQKYVKQNEALQNIIGEKQLQMNDLRGQYDRKYELYIMSIKQMKQRIQQYEIKMQKMQNIIIGKDTRINEVREQYMRLKDENSILYKRIQNIKQQYSRSSSSLQLSVVKQNNLNRDNNARSAINNVNNKSIDNNNDQQQTKVNKYRKQSYQNDNNKKNNNSTSYQQCKRDNSRYNLQQKRQQNVKNSGTKASRQIYDKRQNYNSSNIIFEQQKQSQHKINHYQSNNKNNTLSNNKNNNKSSNNKNHNNAQQNNKNHNNTQQQQQNNSQLMMKQQQGTITIQQSNQPSQFITYSFQKLYHHQHSNNQNNSNNNQNNNNSHSIINKQQYQYQLQKIILIYQNIIQNQLSTIQQLQQKVLEFLKDALLKQNQAELLYSQLCQYQNNLNALMVQKLDRQLDNQRLKKLISDSQYKLSLLGNRLINIAKNNSHLNSKSNPSSSSSIEEHSTK